MRLHYGDEVYNEAIAMKSLSVFRGALRLAWKLYDFSGEQDYLHQAFYFAERSKAVLLLASMQDANAKSFASIPPIYIEQEKEYRADIHLYEDLLQKAHNMKDTSQIRKYQDKLFNSKRSLEELISTFENDYPAYYELKYNHSLASIHDIQEKLLTPTFSSD